ncbi:MAG: hypothetical protein V3R25_10195 [Nitrosomonadaceae bacterium]
MARIETVKPIVGNTTVLFANLGRTRYIVAGDFSGGTITVLSHSQAQDISVIVPDITPFTANTVIYSDDPFLQFSMAGGGAADVTVSSTPIISLDRGA